MKYFSLFTGIGGLEMGIADWMECVGFSEIKKSSIEIYKKNYPSHVNFGDITKIDYQNMPDFDLLTGGFPCQAFSLAGNRKGFNDRRGQMIFYIYDILMAKRPKYAVLENVKGLLSHKGGETYDNVFRLLMSAGYNVRVLLLNALHYGTAQNRERIIFLCSLEEFEKKRPVIIDDTKRFRDIRDGNDRIYKDISRTDRNVQKVEQELDFNFELVGGYDRVGTLTTQFGCGEKCVPYTAWYRYLTALECERLQGFPDNWTEGVKDVHRYFALGNAVNCNVSNYLFRDYLYGLWW